MSRPNLPKICLVCVVLLAAVTVGCLVVWLVPSRPNRARPPARHPLVGTWTRARSGPPTAILDIRADGTASRTDFQNASGANPVTFTMRWRVEGDTFIFEIDARSVLGKLQQLAGGGPPGERIPILSVSEDEIKFGDPKSPTVFQRYEGHLTKHLNRE